jgi:hypothetical protein
MILFGNVSVTLLDRPLFIKKIAVVFAATFVLVPLVYFKLFVPAGIYLASLLALHVLFLYIYFSKVDWRRLAQSRTGFAVRILAVALFAYLLAVLKFHGDFAFVMANLFAGLAIHSAILFALMAEIETVSAEV